MVDKVDCVVVGAGVVGLAVARALALRGREVLVLEAAPTFGTGTSARNSEVIHAGLYYPQGSLKARLCVQGRALLYAYCAERAIPHQRCGKLVVATADAQRDALRAVQAHALGNGVALPWLERDAARALEPALECVAALHSPDTGIVDSHALMLALLADVEQAGGILAVNSAVAHMECAQGAINVIANDGAHLLATAVVNAAGLAAPALALRTQGLDAVHVPQPRYAKGNYFTLAGRAPFSRLIYPVPEAAGLGVHLTLDLGGQARFGPDVQWVEAPDDLAVDPARGQAFYAEVRKYWPGLRDGALEPGYAGIRPKVFDAQGAAITDFVVQGPAAHGVPGLVNLFGIESPGLTSALALGEHVAQIVA